MPVEIVIVEYLEETRIRLTQMIAADPELAILGWYNNSEDATKAIAASQPDIVIIDIIQPGINGIQCIARIKPIFPEIQFVVFTDYEDDDKVFESLKAGASGYLLKNTKPDELVNGLKELSKGGSPLTASIARKLVTFFQQQQIAVVSKHLSDREKEVLQLLGQGLLYKEIAKKLSISPNTVRQHIHNLYEKLHVQNRVEAINKVTRKR